MKIFKAKIASGGAIYNIDAIEWKGKLWLVPHWLGTSIAGETTPGRIIRFDSLPYQDIRGSNLADFVLISPIPKELLQIESLKQPILGFEYEDMPALEKSEGGTEH